MNHPPYYLCVMSSKTLWWRGRKRTDWELIGGLESINSKEGRQERFRGPYLQKGQYQELQKEKVSWTVLQYNFNPGLSKNIWVTVGKIHQIFFKSYSQPN